MAPNTRKNTANTLSIHKKGLSAYYNFPISTGPFEGINNSDKSKAQFRRSVS